MYKHHLRWSSRVLFLLASTLLFLACGDDSAEPITTVSKEDSTLSESGLKKDEGGQKPVIQLTEPSFELGGVQFKKARYISSDTLQKLADGCFISPRAMHVRGHEVGIVLNDCVDRGLVKYIGLATLDVKDVVSFPDSIVFSEANRGEGVLLRGYHDRGGGTVEKGDIRCGEVIEEQIEIRSEPCLVEWASTRFDKDLPSYYDGIRHLTVPLFAHAGDTLVVLEDGSHILEVTGSDVQTTVELSALRGNRFMGNMGSFGQSNDPILGIIENTVFLISDQTMLQTRHIHTGAADTLRVRSKMESFGFGKIHRNGNLLGVDAYFDGQHIFLFYRSKQGALYVFRTVGKQSRG